MSRNLNINWDYIVVGSGPSGGRIAQDLIQNGAKVLLLEAGPHFKTKDFPKPEIQSSSQMFWGGGVELNHDARLGFLRAKCVGGTSVVNQALFDRFDDYVWDEWSAISGIKFSDEDILPHYEAVEKTLSIETIQKKDFGENTKLFIKAFEKKNLGWTPLNRGQKNCGLEQGNDCIACLGGCGRGSKQSSLVTAVEPALQKGLELLADCEVESIKEIDGHVQVKAILKNRQNKTSSPLDLQASAVILAAGSFGTTKIMLQSEMASSLKALGQSISCHPQYMTFSLFDKPVDSFKGAFQAVKSYDKNLREAGFKFENVFAPPIATSMLLDGFGSQHQNKMQKFRYMASMEVAIRDEASGQMSLKNGKMHVNKSLTAQDERRMAQGLQLIVEMFESVEAKEIIRCKQAFGLHLMSGCAIGTDESKSVVNPEFKVHGTKKVFIADSSIFPSAPGINPSLSVMALSHKAMPSIMKGAV
jgi:choline dehydrogenase-like flavoprotein